MNHSRLIRILCLCLLLLILTSSIYARNRYDWEAEDLREGEETQARRASDSNLRFYLGLLPLWIALAMLVAFAWKRKGYNFWSTFVLSLFISPLMMLFILRYFPEKQFKSSGELSTLSMLALTRGNTGTPAKRNDIVIPREDIEEDITGVINDEINMILISGGSFRMGSETDEDANTDNQVTVQSFYLSKYPVTQRLWQAVMGRNPSAFKGKNLPVESVNWYEAVRFCNKLSSILGLSDPYTIMEKPEQEGLDTGSEEIIVKVNQDTDGYRLPTEAEWEYAARGGYESENTEFAGSNLIVQVGWFDFNSEGQTHPVGKKKANELGLHDMSGNVWEWCLDRYYDHPLNNRDDNSNGESTKGRVIRGGSWDYAAYRSRVNHRFFRTPDSSSYDVGLRLARNYQG